MKRYLYAIVSLLLIYSNAISAQKQITVNVKSDTVLDEVLPKDMIYEFQDFENAKLFIGGNSMADLNINYNLVSKVLLFKNKSGHIVEYAHSEHINSFVVRDTIWIPVNGGFGKVIYSNNKLDVVKFRQTECTDVRKEGAFGGVSSTSSTTSLASVFSGGSGSSHSLITPGEYDFKTKVYYFFYAKERALPVNLKNLRKLMPEKSSAINQVMKSKRYDLFNEGELLKLLGEI